jgi:hypothetical protein
MEDQCMLVCERGYESDIKYKILRKEDINILNNIKENDVIFCKTDFIHLLAYCIDVVKHSFYLVSGRSDYTIPESFPNQSMLLLNNNKVKKWYAVNCVSLHEKLVPLPLGISYHDSQLLPIDQERELISVKSEFIPIEKTSIKAVTNFHHSMSDPPPRKMFRTAAYKALQNNDCVIWLSKQERVDFWKSCNDNLFVICPFGNGPDTHRVYEVLALGRVPIVFVCYLNKSLFEDLPVVIVSKWEEIDKDFLENQKKIIVEKFNKNEYKLEKITSAYWKKLIMQSQ